VLDEVQETELGNIYVEGFDAGERPVVGRVVALHPAPDNVSTKPSMLLEASS